MPNHSVLRTTVLALLTATILSGCASGEGPQTGATDPAGFESGGYQQSLPDLDPRDLVGLDSNGFDYRVFTEKYAETPRGDGQMHDFGGIQFSTTILDISPGVFPELPDLQTLAGSASTLAACTTLDESDGAYDLFIGVVPEESSSAELIERGRAGEFNHILQARFGCQPWGPNLPLSEMR